MITNNISKTQMVGRCQIINQEGMLFVIDGAQNNKSSKALINVVSEYIKNLDDIIWIYGVSEGHN